MLLHAELLVSDLKCSEEVVSGILASRLQALVQSPKHIPPQSTVGGHCKRLLRFAVLPAEDLPAPTGPSSVCGSRWPVQERQKLQKGRPDTRPEKDVARLCGKDGDQAVEVQDLANASVPIDIRGAHEGLCPTHLGRPSRRDAEQSSHAAATMVSGYGFHHVSICGGRLGLRALG